jgi:hypothetical protein
VTTAAGLRKLEHLFDHLLERLFQRLFRPLFKSLFSLLLQALYEGLVMMTDTLAEWRKYCFSCLRRRAHYQFKYALS